MNEKHSENRIKSQFFPSLIKVSHDFAQRLFPAENASAQKAYAVDGTAVNGHDTVFLAGLVGSRGRVFAYDVQEKAVEVTRAALSRSGLESRVALFGHGHERLREDLSGFFRTASPEPVINAAMFNFGFLPGSDKTCVTRPRTSLTALDGLLPWMRPGGGLSLHLYAGHPGGEEEARAIIAWAEDLSWERYRVMRHEFVNKTKNRETLLLIEALE